MYVYTFDNSSSTRKHTVHMLLSLAKNVLSPLANDLDHTHMGVTHIPLIMEAGKLSYDEEFVSDEAITRGTVVDFEKCISSIKCCVVIYRRSDHNLVYYTLHGYKH